MRLFKIFLLSSYLTIFILTVNAESAFEYYRSNANGLKLVKISYNEARQYKYFLLVELNDGRMQNKTLYKDNNIVKRWRYYYTNEYLTGEIYYKEGKPQESYKYDYSGHKIEQIDYKNNSKIKLSVYRYNKDGLVDFERNTNLINQQITDVIYRYDSDFRIKQIEKRFSDGRIVYWEAFFSPKGIVQKEYYTLRDEVYTFWYNEDGQEIRGEVKKVIDKNQTEIKKQWINFYTSTGKKERKEESNFVTGNEIKTWYNSKFKETRVETSHDGAIVSIELYEYNEHNKITKYELIEDLNSDKSIYEYDEKDNMIKSYHYRNDILKKTVIYHPDKSRTEILYANNRHIVVEYDINGKIIDNIPKTD